MPAEQRRHQRHPVEMRVRMRLPEGDVEAYTSQVSLAGMSVRLPAPIEPGAEVSFIAHLPDGNAVLGAATCQNVLAGNLAGFSLRLEGQAAESWRAFIAQEASTGALWRMISRYREGQDAAGGSAREVVLEQTGAGTPALSLAGPPDEDHRLRFHTVGENGEAYRVLFERCESDAGFDSDLMEKIPGFDRLAERAVTRVLRDEVVLRQTEHTAVQKVRVAELTRGGYAYVQGGDGQVVGLVSLGLGELILIEVDGERVFPHFTEEELERIACDTFRSDLGVTMFGPAPSTDPGARPTEPAEPAPTEGLSALEEAQQRASQVETRTYGARTIKLYPQVWARSRQADGFDVMGPTMADGERKLLLVLVGAGAPRIVRLDEDTDVKLMVH